MTNPNSSFCSSCGNNMPSNTAFCSKCGTQASNQAQTSAQAQVQPPYQPQFQGQPQVPNYLIPSVIFTVLCCWPVGIVSIVYALQVNKMLAIGNVQGAIAASNKAKTWMFVTIGLGIVAIILAIISGAAGEM